MKIKHLILKYKWYDMILSGEKKEEYRDMKYIKYLCKYGHLLCGNICGIRHVSCHDKVVTDFTHVCLHRGYTGITMLMPIKKISVGFGKPEWGAPEERVVIIHL